MVNMFNIFNQLSGDLKRKLKMKKKQQSIDALIDKLSFHNVSVNVQYSSKLKAEDCISLEDLLKKCEFEEISPKKEEIQKIKRLKYLSTEIDNYPRPKNLFNEKKKYKIDYQNELNNEQLIATVLIDKPLLVIAGAGSGKTRVIVHKVAYLIENGISPNKILLLTFTRKSANEMLDRVKILLGDKLVGGVIGGTFHSFSNYILRKYHKTLNISPNFTINDAQDSADILSLIKDELFPDKKGKIFPKKRTLQDIVSKSKNMQKDIKYVVEKYFRNHIECIDEIIKIEKGFQEYKKRHNIFDYDDLMDVLRDELKHNSIFRESIQKNIKYVLVDEYQDTNNVQREIIELIVGSGKGITVVGDDSQSIYSFRGANYENILRFSESFPNCECVKIEENYRSGQEILEFTNEIIKNSQIGFKKKLTTKKCVGSKPIIKNFSDETQEAVYVADKILELRKKDLDYSNFAVLTRAGWHSNVIQIEFSKRSIPYVVFGGIKFSERKHIKDIIAFLKIVLNSIDAVAWHRVLKLIGGVGKVRATEIIETIKENRGQIVFDKFSSRSFYKTLSQYEKFYQEIDKNTPPSELIKNIMNFYEGLLKQIDTDNYKIRLEDISTFILISNKYSDLEKFLSDFALEPTSNKYQDSVQQDDMKEKPVIISTIHSAKGLEWNTVFIPYALDGIIPSRKSINSLEDVEEERRLFYVATSRAKENLFITMPAYVSSWDAVFTLPSRFIKEIEKSCYDLE